ncbi:mothers against decapentaplegic homolog 6-like isoform X1 [Tigriopus californicus]|uniref:mothers against decapentaplegic homolog 6-like isoform X1 n=1 Tax=Tigriopus californicus TaxID=6832 RepID=UPI0027DA0738|nr:mothers against decapentaplegic homolog 6-like isoform X1 [Tigriopus californicus]
MFMFRSCRINQLVNKLLQYETKKEETWDHDDYWAVQGPPPSKNHLQERRTLSKSLLKRLSEIQLRALLRSVESEGSLDTSCGSSQENCVIVSNSVVIRRDARVRVDPKVLTCQLFRWIDLRDDLELKRLPFCQAKLNNHGDIQVECCNPYHWSRVWKPISVSEDLSPELSERLQSSSPDLPLCGSSNGSQEIQTPNEKRKRIHEGSSGSEKCPQKMSFKHIDPGEYSEISSCSTEMVTSSSCLISHSTHGTQLQNQYGFTSQVGLSKPGSRPWCRLAYWECKDRRGEPFPVISNSVDVFTHLPKGSGLCLENVFGQSPIPKDKAVLKTRQKIGQGILLSHEDSTGQVWVYNRTRDAIFVHSPTLDPPAPRMDVVHKIMPGRSAQIFDYEKSWIFQRDRDPRDFPMDPYSVQISFVKGWGREYKRPDVLLCPCWLEIRMERRTKR